MPTPTPTPIQLSIPPTLSHLRIPLSNFLTYNPPYHCLAVGACIFFPPPSYHQQTPSPPRLLLIQRASTERGFPNLWEIPGGSSEESDPTVLHSVAREVFEETGLLVCKFQALVGEGVEFSTGTFDNVETWLKLAFEVEVVEIPQQGLASTANVAALKLNEIAITLDPEEHQQFAWATEEEVRRTGPGAYQITTEAQREVMLQAFALRSVRNQQFLPLTDRSVVETE